MTRLIGSKKLNILMLAPTPFFADRGCHIRILEEIIALKKRGHKVTLLTYHIGRDIKGVDIVRIPGIFYWYKKLSAGPSWSKPFMDILMVFKTISLLKKNKYDIIHAHLHEGALVGIIGRFLSGKRVPILFDYQGSLSAEIIAHNFIQKTIFLLPLFKIIEKGIDKASDHIIPSSTAARSILLRNFDIDPSKVTVFLDQVNTDRFKPLKKNKKLLKGFGIGEDDLVIGYLGILTKYQGIDLMLESIKILNHDHASNKNIKFLVLGYPNEDMYREKAREMGISENIIFTGRTPYEENTNYLNLFDVAVSPKLVTSESNGKLLNYMACGLPIVAFDTPINKEILKTSGLLIDKITPKAFAAGIKKLILNQDFRLRLRKQARKDAVKYYSWGKFLNDLEGLYSKLLSNK